MDVKAPPGDYRILLHTLEQQQTPPAVLERALGDAQGQQWSTTVNGVGNHATWTCMDMQVRWCGWVWVGGCNKIGDDVDYNSVAAQ